MSSKAKKSTGNKKQNSKNAASSKKRPAGKGAGGGEVQVQKSPAEFFAENQAIAGFDNAGKSLFTSIRELVENSLDASESIMELPEIFIEIREFTTDEFNEWRGDPSSPRKKADVDEDLFQKRKKPGAAAAAAAASAAPPPGETKTTKDDNGGDDDKEPAEETTAAKKTTRKKPQQEGYFLLSVKDNGCGMAHNAIPDLLGRVLSGSKYGVRQTRGKFGLGAKMALIWSKKSTGFPIKIITSHRPSGGPPASKVSTCSLDIDIYKNEPVILEHSQRSNNTATTDTPWIGTKMELVIMGNWTTYKARILSYLQQLAIITPYAVLELQYTNESDEKRNCHVKYNRRSEQMPPPAQQVKHHPASVNNLVIQHLIQTTRTNTLVKFLSTELAAVSPALAKRIVVEAKLDPDVSPKDLKDGQITRLVQLFHRVQLFKAPDGSCLSPLGEYNLNLGIRKVLEPDYVATSRDKAGAHEGHPFVVEAAVSLGGKHVKEGITVQRFANRIPLLFEGGADVSTRVAQTKIKWANYKIDQKRDRIGVFVSIVSTKIPFKGTSKEYIGDDATEIQQSVKRALQSCCQQLRVHLQKHHAIKDAKERKSRLAKYIPDVGRSLFAILQGMRERHAQLDQQSTATVAASTTALLQSPTKRLRLDPLDAKAMLRRLDEGQVTEEGIKKSLRSAIDDDDVVEDGNDNGGGGLKSGTKRKRGMVETPDAIPLFLVPLYNMNESANDIHHPLFTFRPLVPVPQIELGDHEVYDDV